jgi:O-acetylhomoserine/O-acetylserine sulfhydrylase-like pyridoxal-dependent enzyme
MTQNTQRAGTLEGLVCDSAGIEDRGDLITDLEQALAHLVQTKQQ